MIGKYIAAVNEKHATGEATEHSYRGALEALIQNLLSCLMKKKEAEQITIINEPRRKAFGAPDYELRRGVSVVSFLETKDIGDTDLRGEKPSMNKEQFSRYKAAISTIAFTNFHDFVLYENGQEKASASIADLVDGQLVMTSDERQLSAFTDMMLKLFQAEPQPITSATELAAMMALKARLMATLIEKHLKETPAYDYDEDWDDPSELRAQYEAFRLHLINDLTEKAFADIYAQTITYGLFAARLHTTTPETFSRAEVPWFIPQTNPFLRSIFSSIAGADLDKNVAWIVDDLTKAFRSVDIKRVMRQYGNATGELRDPLLHFYEDFLAAYDPQARKDNGVWYTPHSIVGFIVRSVDEVLQRDFHLTDGLANRETIEKDNRQYHRVQILDPATGTGTFLAEIVNQIYDCYRSQPGLWQQYVEDDLLPRLSGFEILMASYAIAHLKLDMVLQKTGYRERNHKRLRIFLTNSLEDQRVQPMSLFDYKLVHESNLANAIKRRYPVMVMVGNPPYNNSSSNNNPWIRKLIAQYKAGVDARKINLDDDYVKFIRLGQYYIERTGEGVLGFVTNNNYLDAVTFKEMRHSLLRSFDDIYILNLHGKVKNHEKAPDGGPDENVFGITLGVSIAIFVKTSNSQHLGRVHHYDLFGKKHEKKEFLNSHSLSTVEWTDITPSAPDYFFIPKDFSMQEEYEKGFRLDELFRHYNSGVQTKRDELNVFFTDDERKAVLRDFQKGDLLELYMKYKLHDSRDWTVERAIKDLKEHPVKRTRINYRPFDDRYTNYTGFSRGMMGFPREATCQHLGKDNMALLTCKQQSSFPFQHVFVTRLISDLNSVSAQSKEQSYVFPLYLYDDKGERMVNFTPEVADRIACSGLARSEACPTTVDPEVIFDYVYAVLHSRHYRKRYKELLRIDFPHIPYPKDNEQLKTLAAIGEKLRRLHLLEDIPAGVNALGVSYLGQGSDVVEKYEWRDDAVYINDENHFQGIPEEVWRFYIGGYQPMQKWLQYRKGRRLAPDDIIHYERMAYAINRTLQLMEKIEQFV